MSNLFNSVNTNTKPPRRVIIWLIPVLLVIVMAVLFMASSWQSLLPKVTVDVARARIGEAASATKEGETLFQAAGWVQPDPYSTSITALVSGIVKKIHVIDGDKVKKGQLLVELIDDDLKLQLANEKARLQELTLEKKDKELMVSTKKVELVNLQSLEDTARAVAKRIKHKADSYRNAKDALPIFETEQAELEYREQMKRVDEFYTRRNILESEIELLQNAVKVAEAKIATQQTIIDKVELDLSRTKIYSPSAGIINQLFAREGRKQMLGSDNENSTTVATLFDPAHIQIMVDVPLVDVSKVKVGQKAAIHSEVLEKPVAGVVTSLHGKADYQKNTLQVHVEVIGGHEALRPDMIAQVMFKSEAPVRNETSEKITGVFIKKEAVKDGRTAWVLNPQMQVVKKTVVLGKAENDGWVQVISGINAGEKVVVSPPENLKEGNIIKVGKMYE